MPTGDGAPIILHANDIRRLVTRSAALGAVRAALQALARGEAIQPDEIAVRTPAGEVHVKGGHVLGAPHLAFKTATSFPGNAERHRAVNDGHTVVLDAETGALAAILLDGGLLTHLRTAAAAALAADHLARSGARRVALIGAGEQAYFQLAALRDVRPVDQVRVWNRTGSRAEDFAADECWHGLDIRPAASVSEAVTDADIVVTATASRSPLVQAGWIRPGMHVTAMGADFVGKQELDPAVLANADLVAADDIATCRRVGELQHCDDAVAARTVSFADIVAGRAPGRIGDADVTVIDQCGLGIYDAAMATAVLAAMAVPTGRAR